jgi:hypothetical protein
MIRTKQLFRGVLCSMLLLAGLVPAVRAQEGPQTIDIDLGTIGISTLGQIAPSRVFRPLDMLGARAGARAWAMGGAYVAQAQGVEGISWNPAGIGWLERPAMTASFRWTHSSAATSGFPDTFNIPNAPQLRVDRYEVNLKSTVRAGIMGFGGMRTLAGHKMSGAVSYRRYMDVTLPEAVIAGLTLEGSGGGGSNNSSSSTVALDNDERGGVDATTATIGFEVIPGQLTAGVNLNYLGGIFRSSGHSWAPSGGLGQSTGYERLKFDYSGFSTDLGVQYRQQGMGAVGASFTPGYTLAVTKGRYRTQSIPLPGTDYVYVLHGVVAGYDIDVPSLMSVGASYDVLPRLTIAVGYDKQAWSKAKVSYRSDESFSGRESNPSLPLRDVTSLHLGAEGRFLRLGKADIPLRVGYAKGPLSMAQLSPHGDHPELYENWTGGDVNSKTMTFGLGFQTGPLHYDLSYEVLDYKINKWYFESPYDAFLNPQGITVKVDRRVTYLRFGGTMNF